MIDNEAYLIFKDFVSIREDSLDFEDKLTCDVLNQSYSLTMMYIESLKPYMKDDTFKILRNNLWLHFVIVDPLMKDLYSKYDIGDKDFIINSASNSGSSTSMQSFKSLEDGEYLMLNLNRTPYGRYAYSILESLKNIVIT